MKVLSLLSNRWFIPLALFLLNFVLKVIYLDSNALGLDEPFSVYHAQMPVADIVRIIYQGNNPPLFEVILHFWIKLFGISEFSVRFPSLLFSSLIAPVFYLIGTKLKHQSLGLVCALLFSFSNFHLYFAHEARVYALFALLCCLSFYFFISILKGDTQFKTKLFYVLFTSLLLYAHYFGFIVIGLHGLLLLVNIKLLKRSFRDWLLSYIAIFLLFLPSFIVLIKRFMISSSEGTWVKEPNGIQSVYSLIRHFSNEPVVAFLSIAGLLAFLVLFFKHRKELAYQVAFIWFFVPVFMLLAISYAVPMFVNRYLGFTSFGFYLMIGLSALYLYEKKAKRSLLVIPALFILAFMFTFKPNYKTLWNDKAVAELVKAEVPKGKTLLFCPDYYAPNFCYYFNRDYFKQYNTSKAFSTIHTLLHQDQIIGLKSIANVDLSSKDEIYYLDAAANFSYPENNILPSLRAEFNEVRQIEIGKDRTLYHFSRNQ